MFRKSEFSEEPSRPAGKPTPRGPRGRRFSTALVLALALALGSAGQPLPAQAAPPSANYNFIVTAALEKPNATICVGDNVLIDVRVLRQKIDDGQVVREQSQTGMWVEGSASNPGIGSFVLTRRKIGWWSDRPQDAVFAFHTTHAGKTTLNFTAEVHYTVGGPIAKWILGVAQYAQSNPVDLNVVNCKFRIFTFSVFKASGQSLTAVMGWTELTADANGQITGDGTATWNGSRQAAPSGAPLGLTCSTKLTAPPSPVKITGQTDDTGEIKLTLRYAPVVAPSWRTTCNTAAPPIDSAVELAPTDLTVIVPSSGVGSSMHIHDVYLAGTAKVFVIPGPKP